MAFYLRARVENALRVFISILPQPWINASENPSTPRLMLLKTKQKTELKAPEEGGMGKSGKTSTEPFAGGPWESQELLVAQMLHGFHHLVQC